MNWNFFFRRIYFRPQQFFRWVHTFKCLGTHNFYYYEFGYPGYNSDVFVCRRCPKIIEPDTKRFDILLKQLDKWLRRPQ